MAHGPRTFTESGMTEEPARKKPGDPIDPPAEPTEPAESEAEPTDDESAPKKPAPKPHKGR